MRVEVAYCPFCGARLRDENDPLFEHLRANEKCSDQFEYWDYTAGGPKSREQELVPKSVMWAIIATVPLSSLVIVQQVLLGVLTPRICTTPSLRAIVDHLAQ